MSAPAPHTSRHAAVEDVHRLNFAWLIRLRWVAIIGQTAVVMVSNAFLDVEFPYPMLSLVLFVEVLSNLALIAWAKTGRPRHKALVALVLLADIAFLTALLFLTGGAYNPFSLLYFIHIALAALLLRPLWTWAVTAVCISCYIGLYFVYASHHLPWALRPNIASMEVQGKWAAFVVSSAVLAFFINMIQQTLNRREEELHRAREAKMRNERLASLATLAAGAAHEFSTPLSTIALVASELHRGLESQDVPDYFLEDARLIREQVERCREILLQLSADAGESMGELARPARIEELVAQMLRDCRNPARVQVNLHTERAASISAPISALAQALRGLINNAIDASAPDQPVNLSVFDDGDHIRLNIEDHGSGMPPHVLARVGEPFFTTKPTGSGMGLGVFLARTLVEKIGGSLRIDSDLGCGTRITVLLPASAPEAPATSTPLLERA
ncbi:HAMP domain-containing histidine kinase [Lujinxingia vulgaris]|uniref:histidine kinase n=1 Tax=Lujinxingia vulgaris TaxID=2600176 RepID=A0A5C6X8E8_9DELT|nr:ATP-binding protein [Lujinxingia vulgaris]TXD38151.1 HAMP domain-containing histidine kinase [Lujinxingia vulgaris]